MSEYIKKEDVLKEIAQIDIDTDYEYDNGFKAIMFRTCDYDEVVRAIINCPPYSFPDREKGEWIRHPTRHEDFDTWVCNKCGEEVFGHENITNFCPNCGADMRGKRRGKSCNTCKNNDDEFSGECYECLKGIFDHYEPESED